MLNKCVRKAVQILYFKHALTIRVALGTDPVCLPVYCELQQIDLSNKPVSKYFVSTMLINLFGKNQIKTIIPVTQQKRRLYHVSPLLTNPQGT